MKIKFVIYSLFAFTFGFSQTHKATISDVKKDGFHRIIISPEVRSACQDNLDYFRILDKSKKEVPYVLNNLLGESSQMFEMLSFTKNVSKKDSVTSLVIPIHDLKNVSELFFLIANTKNEKQYSISGGDNLKDWFGLVSNERLGNLNNENGTYSQIIISFPKTSYKYLKIEFDDKKSLPINVLQVGYLKSENTKTQITTLKDFKYSIVEDKKNKKTRIFFSSKNPHTIDGIKFKIGTKFYYRNCNLIFQDANGKSKYTYGFELNSKNSDLYKFSGSNANKFILEVDNKDDQPLRFESIEVLQNLKFLYCDLKANEKYEVIIDTTLSKPNYDLVNFTQNLTADLPLATISNLKKLDAESKDDSEKSFWEKPIFLWSAILLTIFLLAYFVRSLLKDVKGN